MDSLPQDRDGHLEVRSLPHEAVAELLGALGYPLDLECSRWTYQGVMHREDGTQWHGSWEMIAYECDGLSMGVVRRRVTTQLPVYWEVLYPATGEPREALHGLAGLTGGDIDAVRRDLWQVVDIVREMAPQGRPRLEDEPWQDWRDLTIKAIRLYRTGKVGSWRAAAAYVGVPYETLRNWRRRL